MSKYLSTLLCSLSFLSPCMGAAHAAKRGSGRGGGGELSSMGLAARPLFCTAVKEAEALVVDAPREQPESLVFNRPFIWFVVNLDAPDSPYLMGLFEQS